MSITRRELNSNEHLYQYFLNHSIEHDKIFADDPESVIPLFKQELLDLGFEFQVLNQAQLLMPKYKKLILPIIIKYYNMATKDRDKLELLPFLDHKGLDDAVPMLLKDYYLCEGRLRWFISDTLLYIKCKKYEDEYINIVLQKKFGHDRQLIVLLLGKILSEKAIPVFIELLEDEEVRLHAISALGYFKREEFRPYFERFSDSKHCGWRKYSRIEIKKLDNLKAKNIKKQNGN